MHKLILDDLLLINHSNMFRPLSRSQHQGVRNPWELQSHCIISRREHIYITTF